jgi:phenylpyruvate tautomerase PptA (4-oxalocrotonate tautomerase family)
LSKTDGVIYYVYVASDGSAQTKELAPGVRGLVSSFLGTTLSSVEFAIDEGRDALWVVYGKKALVLRRPNLLEKERPWEQYTFTMDETIYRMQFTGKRRTKWIRSDGKLDDVEYDSQASTWLTTDNGAAIASYWTSKVFYGPNRRIDQVTLDRETITDPATITAYSERYTSGNSRTIAASTRTARFGALQTGTRHWFKIAPGGSSMIRGLDIEEKPAGGRRGA